MTTNKRKYWNAYYQKNKEKLKERTRLWHQQNRQQAIKYQKENHRKKKLKAIEYLGGCCKKCGEKFHPSVYDFHHVNPLEKDKGIAQIISLGWTKIQLELDKCILLCANCHREIHHNHDQIIQEFPEDETTQSD